MSLKNLQDGPPKTLDEALQAAQRLISNRTGIISTVEFSNLTAEEPSVYFARSTPANSTVLNGMKTIHQGDATSIDPKRAIMKAVGESIERYCPGHYNYEDFILSAYNELNCDAVHPEDFALVQRESNMRNPIFHFLE